MNQASQWQLRLPDWVGEQVADALPGCTDDTARMQLAIDLAAGNLSAGDGGPFGALVWDERNNRLIAPGINMVFASNASFAHAEMVALTLAQATLVTPDLSAYELTLYTSAEPCAMCLGALPWSGIKRLVCGASDADIRAVGFDEGSKPAGWVEALHNRGIDVRRAVLRDAASQVLKDYVSSGAPLY